jgi:hypothetical protein
MNNFDAFISYHNNAKKVVDYLVGNLERSGINCWYAPRNIINGQKYYNTISNAISNAGCVIAVMSDEALNSQCVKHEISIANDLNIPIIPFEIAPISIQNELAVKLATRHKIVAYKTPSNSIKTLINSINKLLSSKDKDPSDFKIRMSNEVGAKGRYSILQNAKGDIMIMLKAREGVPKNPRFIYDGSETALLYRDPDSSVAFKDIDEEARQPLKEAKEILVVEIENDDVERDYMVPVRIVKNVENLML